MNSQSLKVCRAELEKIAKTRAAIEAEKAFRGGDQAGLNEIAAGHAQLGLKPRQVGDVGQGAEGLAQLMMGEHPDVEGNLHIRKTMDPYSSISRGAVTTDLMDAKMKATTAMREAAAQQGGHVHVPQMGGVVIKNQGVPGMERHQSVHQYVPEYTKYTAGPFPQTNPGTKLRNPTTNTLRLQEMEKAVRAGKFREAFGHGRDVLKAMKEAPLERVSNVLQAASKKTKVPINDAIISRGFMGSSHGINPGNVVNAGGKPAILDVLPATPTFRKGILDRLAGQGGEVIRAIGNASSGHEALRMAGEDLPLAVGALRGGAPTAAKTIQREFYNPQVAAAAAPAKASLKDLWGVAKKIPSMARAARGAR